MASASWEFQPRPSSIQVRLRADQAGAVDNDNLHFTLLILFGRPRRLNPREVADHEEQVQEPEGEPDRCDDTKV